ncbi:hypothetical protein EDC96DRAFT_523888 [Choanephora cucurbitarum]|nr:hypothetical protein EDC96DRAFT_523888 [Choanephora cucurbitarum]
MSRETRVAVDSILVLIETAVQAFSMQTSRSACLIATHQQAGNSICSFCPVYHFLLPFCIEELESFRSTVQKLISFQQHVAIIANILERTVEMLHKLTG